ncbi:MAG TPA: IS630 family transposase [Streptosporangiaceae bacterium]|jgi:transposase
MTLSDSQRNELRAELAPEGYDGSVASRAQIVLWHDGGRSAPEIAALMSTSKVTVYKWLQRYQEGGLAALGSRKSTGRPRGISGEARSRILALTRQAPPESTGLTHWSSYEMARYLRRNEGIEVSHNFISVLWRENGIKPHRQGTFKLSRDPDFTAKVVDVVGLYLDPPAGAVVLSVDEKTQVQALDRTQPLLPVSFGKTEKRTHDYKRNGTTNLFAAFDTGTGEVTGRCFSRRRTREFLMFMDEMAQRHPSQETHVVLDNLSTHSGPQVSKWLARHQNFRFHYTPVGSSWLNQVEMWFGIITRQAIRRGTFSSVRVLTQAISNYISSWNEDSTPFKWTATADEILEKVALVDRDFRKLLACNLK